MNDDTKKPYGALDTLQMFPDFQVGKITTSQLISKTQNVPIAAGTAQLPHKGDWALQTNGGTVVLAVCIAAGTTIYFNPSGTL